MFDTTKKTLLVELRRGADPAKLYWYVIDVHFCSVCQKLFKTKRSKKSNI